MHPSPAPWGPPPVSRRYLVGSGLRRVVVGAAAAAMVVAAVYVAAGSGARNAARVAVLEGKPGDEPTVNDINSPSEQAARIMGSVESGLPYREVGFHIPGPGTVFPSSRLGGSLKLHAAVARRTADSRMLGAMMHHRVCYERLGSGR